MCGIAGIINLKQKIDINNLKKMSKALSHRGPDGCGYLFYSPKKEFYLKHKENIRVSAIPPSQVGFAHRKLAIIDLPNQNLQPLVDEGGKYAIIFDGRIYNNEELAKALKKAGHSVKTKSDAEVFLKAYAAWGKPCFKKINGIWACAILDFKRNKVILSRDRVAIKPLYYSIYKNTLYFASEIKSLFKAGIRPFPNEKMLADYLFKNLVFQTEETFFKNIYQLPPASFAEISLENQRIEIKPKAFWLLTPKLFKGTKLQAIKEFRKLFFDCIAINTQGKTPAGALLSGGVDSSAMACSLDILKKEKKAPNYSSNVFSYVSPEKKCSEEKYVKIVEKKVKAKVHYIKPSVKKFLSFLPEILQQQTEPLVSSTGLAQWFAFFHAKKHGAKIILNGLGIDGLFGEYIRHFPKMLKTFIKNKDIINILALRLQNTKMFNEELISNTEIIKEIGPKWLKKIFSDKKEKPLNVRQNNLSVLFKNSLTEKIKNQRSKDVIKIPTIFQPLRRFFLKYEWSFGLIRQSRYLDINSTIHGIENRVPFLDHRLIEFIFSLPEEWKTKGSQTKLFFREAMKGILPEKIRNRQDKLGFRASASLTFTLAEKNFQSLAKNKTYFEKKWFSEKGVKKFFKESGRSRDAEFKLWRIINTKLWARQFWGNKNLNIK